MIPIAFDTLLAVTGARWVAGDRTRMLSGLSTDTRTLNAGDLFLSLRGPNFDGDAFAAQALGQGAGGMLLNHASPEGFPGACPWRCIPIRGVPSATWRAGRAAAIAAM
ncbi:MAG: hypothetical protein R3F17_04140 [Planctomycetota bacterium]